MERQIFYQKHSAEINGLHTTRSKCSGSCNGGRGNCTALVLKQEGAKTFSVRRRAAERTRCLRLPGVRTAQRDGLLEFGDHSFTTHRCSEAGHFMK